ncbi:MAG TPA: rhamnulokinase family protein [Candidatus Limnocylindrales bacterium]|nr:rhamnulokinase family protein [Candidatus Limnocylindrales bacterium]
MTGGVVAAIDLGASSVRVLVARVGPGQLAVEEVHRARNEPVALPDGLHWDVLRLHHEVVAGLRLAARAADEIAGIAVDGWGIDYALLDEDGSLLANPYHHRDPRHGRGVDIVHAAMEPRRLYERTGTQFLPFNTLYQLAAGQGHAAFDRARTVLLIPDLIGFWLCGVVAAERTNASTTGLLDVRTRSWAPDVLGAAGVSPSWLAPLCDAGEAAGPIRPAIASETGLSPRVEVGHVGSHDTASAVVAMPAVDDRVAFISCGTWSLVGIELSAPLVTEAGRVANFTNELGVDGRVRYLRNVMGLWLLQESLRAWERGGEPEDLGRLLAAAAALPAGGPVIDPDDPILLAPGDMPERIRDLCRRSGQPAPSSRAALARCVLDSLAAAYARAIADATRLTGRDVRAIHLVGGGARNELLCQLTADATGLPVVAGPVEATAIGNALVQARRLGFARGDLDALRALVRTHTAVARHEPRSRT